MNEITLDNNTEEQQQTDSSASEQTTPKKPAASNFFKTTNNPDINEFIKHMQQPREHIDPPPFMQEFDEEKDSKLPGESDEKLADYLNFDEGHLYTAETILGYTDMLMAFLISLKSGEDAEKYMAFKKRTVHNQRVMTAGAALVKKYEAKLSLEFMFLAGWGSLYAIMYGHAVQDAKANAARAQETQEEKQARTIKMVKEDAA